ncbi:hypothetical protein SD70_14515 [Gordoniibacillus kamchatkensis]|uniref:S-adenosylmethionine decarboxylase n=1 Tax=Gordoniibacillus kamchatkensis TaxID=1590651 RepID=A0ABR5AHF0_9BACL|nr:hypothetical protein SD70_14515 [Paenibacillus sp. VKM B-2647]
MAAAAALAILLLWSVSQTVGMLRSGGHSDESAVRLLYQVSELHIELLGSQLKQAAGAKTAAELEPLKQALYTAAFTHDKLVKAVGEQNLTPLHSLTELSQLMLRLQLGGTRAVKPDEAALLQETAGLFAELEESYGKLLSSGDAVVASQNRAIAETDEKLVKLLQKHSQK